MIRRLFIPVIGLWLVGIFSQRDVQAQDDDKIRKYQRIDTRPAAKGRVDVNDAVWRAKYRLGETSDRRSYKRFLEEEADVFGWSSDLNELVLISDERLSASRHITYQQQYEGLPVEGRFVRVNLDRNDKPTMVLSGFAPINRDTGFSSAPVLYRNNVAEHVKDLISDPRALVDEPKLVVMVDIGPNSVAKASPVLVWKTIAWPSDYPAELVMLIDAKTGDLLIQRDEAISMRSRSADMPDKNTRSVRNLRNDPTLAKTPKNRIDGSGYVYDPDPLTVTGVTYGPPFVDNGDAPNSQLDAARSLVTLPDISTDSQGLFVLSGPHVQIVGFNQSNATTYTPPTSATSDGFLYDRSDFAFEAVNAYYHIDKSQRYVQSLGILDRQNLSIEVNPRGLTNDDSFYFPSRNFLIFGSGGVDDAEDASVLWHEYGHALLNGGTPGLLSSLEGSALHEGWADYWAASYARHLWETGAVARSDWDRLFRWDSGDGAIWNGRVLDHNGTYPGSTCSDDPAPINCSAHNDGRLWATVLMELYTDLGRAVVDEIGLRSHTYLIPPVTFSDAAEAVIQADLDYFDGAHLATLLDRFGSRGLINAGSFAPTVFHDELPWSEDLGGTITVSAEVIGISAPVSEVVMKYSTTSGSEVTLPLQSAGNDLYQGELQLPTTDETISYYIEATDTGSRKGFIPQAAPVDLFSFSVGLDTEPPELTHTPIESIPLVTWPPEVQVIATDNLGIDQVEVTYRIESADAQVVAAGQFLLNGSGDIYSGIFPVDSGSLPRNVVVYYSIVAVDAAGVSNSTRVPNVDEIEFRVRSEGVIRSFDFEVPTSGIITTGIWEIGEPSFGLMTAHTGNRVVGTSLNSAYPEVAQLSVLELPRVNLKSVSNGLLVFWHWYDTEHDGTADPSGTGSQIWDGGILEFSIDEGEHWHTLTPETGYNGVIAQSQGNPISLLPAFGGYSYGWRQIIAPLPEAEDVRVRFSFGTDVSNVDVARNFAGWYLDDIRVTTERPDDSEVPSSTSLPPDQVTLSTEEIQPVVTGYFSDDNGVTDVFVDYTYTSSGSEISGTLRMEQDVTRLPEFFTTLDFLSSPSPSDQVEYSFRVLDYSGNTVRFPAASAEFVIDYELITQTDITQEVSVSGIWEDGLSGWISTGVADPFSFISSINFIPFDLPLNSTGLQFSILHNYDLAPDFGGNIKISDDEGRSWAVLNPVDGYPGTLDLESFHLMDGESGFTGPSNHNGDFYSIFNLDGYAGQQVRIRIDLATPRAAGTGEIWRIESAGVRQSTDQDGFEIVRSFDLHQAYPNPFDTVSNIEFTLENAGTIELSIYDMLGRRVHVIADGFFEEGSYKRQVSAYNLTAGLYIVRLQTAGKSASQKIVVTN